MFLSYSGKSMDFIADGDGHAGASRGKEKGR